MSAEVAAAARDAALALRALADLRFALCQGHPRLARERMDRARAAALSKLAAVGDIGSALLHKIAELVEAGAEDRADDLTFAAYLEAVAADADRGFCGPANTAGEDSVVAVTTAHREPGERYVELEPEAASNHQQGAGAS